uniref:Cadherin domain-containing protein n=1 Tax=Anopheles minimus TaxID=112268 RepID=A0A182W2N2_9DIPT
MMVTSFLSKPILPAVTAHSVLLLAILLVTSCAVPLVEGKLQLCEVETGQSSIILDIEESRGSSVAQHTNPPELPISGDPNDDITLELVFPKGKPTFLLDGKSLRLIHPLDRDEENLSHIVFQITCMVRSTRRKRNIPIIVRVSDVNDNPPMFINTPYETTVPEVGSALDLSTQTPPIEHWSHLAVCSSCTAQDRTLHRQRHLGIGQLRDVSDPIKQGQSAEAIILRSSRKCNPSAWNPNARPARIHPVIRYA